MAALKARLAAALNRVRLWTSSLNVPVPGVSQSPAEPVRAKAQPASRAASLPGLQKVVEVWYFMGFVELFSLQAQ